MNGNVDQQLEEFERQRAEELRRQQEQDRQRQSSAGEKVREVGGKMAGTGLKKAGKKLAKKGAARAAAGIAASAGALSGAFWAVVALLLIIAVALVIVLFFVVMTSSVAVLCEPQSFTGRLAGMTLKSTGYLTDEQCEAIKGLKGVASFIDQAKIQQVPQGQQCPAHITPEKTPTPDMKVECIDCVDMSELDIPVKRENTNPLANRDLAGRLQGVVAVNTTFRVTEGFCPAANHASTNHYNGFAVDVNLKPEFLSESKERKIELLTDLSQDLIDAGFTRVLCEYPESFSSGSLKCGAKETTRGSHIHIEEPNEFN